MFGRRYFGAHFFGPRYFAAGGAGSGAGSGPILVTRVANTLGIWSDLEYAGGVLIRSVKDWVRCRFGTSVDGETGLTIDLPQDHDALADIGLNTVFRVVYRGAPYEFRCFTTDDDIAKVDTPFTTITALPAPLHDLGFLFLRQTTAGVPLYTGSASLLTPTEYLNTIILPSLVEQGKGYYELDTVTPTSRRSMEWDNEFILAFLRRLVARDQVEVSCARNTGTGKYKIGLKRIGYGATDSVVWVGNNAVALQRAVSRDTLATVIRPTSPVQTGAAERDHIGAVEFAITARTGAQYTLAHPAGDTDVDPIAVDDQYNSQYAVLRLREGPMNLANTVNVAFAIKEVSGFVYHSGSNKTLMVDTGNAVIEWTGPPPTPNQAQKRVALGSSVLGSGMSWPVYATAQDRYIWMIQGTTAADTKIVLYNPNTGAVASSTEFTGKVADFEGAIHAANGYLYFGDGTNSKVWVYDPATDTMITSVTIATTNYGIVSGATQGRIYCWGSDRQLRVINPTGHTVTATLDLTSYVSAAFYGAVIVGTDLYVCGREVTTSYLKVLKVSLASVDAPSYTGAVTGPDVGGSCTMRGIAYSPSLDRVLVGGHLLGTALADGAYVFTVTVTGSFALESTTQVYEQRTGFYPYVFREIDGVPYWQLGKGILIALGPSGTNHQIKAVSDTTADSNQLVTLSSAFPATQTDQVTGDTPFDRALLRVSDHASGAMMTELVNDAAVQQYDRVVREIRSEDYLIGDASSIVNLLPNGGLRTWDANGFLYGMSKPSNRASASPKGPRWTSPDANSASAFSAGVTATWSAGRITTISVTGLPAGLVAQAGDIVAAAGLSTVTLCGRTVCTGTADVLSVYRIDQAGSGTGVAATLSRPDPASFLAWLDGATDALSVGNPTLSTVYEAAGYTYYGLGAAHMGLVVAPPLWPRVGVNLYIGADVGYLMYSGNFPASQKGGLAAYKYSGDAAALEVYATDLPTSSVTAQAIYPRTIEGSIALTAFHQPLIVHPINTAASGVQMYFRRIWAYVANESHATAMALDGAGPAYRLWRLGQQSAEALSTPQIHYAVQALEKQATPFLVGGDVRLVDRGRRNVDATVRIVSIERDLVESDVEREFPVLTVNNRENDLTSRLIDAGHLMTIQSVAFNGVPVEDYGYACHDVGDWLSLPEATFATVNVAGVPGEVEVNTPAKLSPAVRAIELSDTTSTTILARRTKLRTLAAAVGGLVEVTFADDPNAISYCLVKGGRGRGVTPLTMLDPAIYFNLSLIADDPYYYQLAPSTYVLRASTRETVPMGTAGCRGLIYVNGGGAGSGAVGIRLRHQSGDILAEMTLDNAVTIAALGALTFASADTMLFDCQNYDVSHYVAASNTWISRLAYLNDGQDFPAFDPLDTPTLEILNGYDGWGVHRKADLL